MANWIRSAKSGNDWTLNDLDSYHITINQVDHDLFFGSHDLPQPSVDQELLQYPDAFFMQQDHNVELVNLLDLAMIPNKEETAVNDFVVGLFRFLGYTGRHHRISRTRVDLPLFISRENRHAKTDVCVFDRARNHILLLVQADRRLENVDASNARAQLVAEAVAAFNANNTSMETVGLRPLEKKVMPGIVMIGTAPVFFKIPVSQTLSTHIRHGSYPPDETHVTFCYHPHLRLCRHNEGMKPLDSRREILRCYEAFKAIVGI